MNYFRTGSDYHSHCSTQCVGVVVAMQEHSVTIRRSTDLVYVTSGHASDVISRQYTAQHLVARAVEG
jgi:hypothetical protein